MRRKMIQFAGSKILPSLYLGLWSYCQNCDRCGLARYAHNHVLARGTLPCDVLFVGEAPGKSEDAIGFPFVGTSGKLLDALLDGCLFSYAITNVVCCRPTNGPGLDNRAPTEAEVFACEHHLLDLSNLADPYYVVALGRVAEEVVRAYKFDIAEKRYIYHPAYILRNGGVGSEKFNEAKQTIKEIEHEVLAIRNAKDGTGSGSSLSQEDV